MTETSSHAATLLSLSRALVAHSRAGDFDAVGALLGQRDALLENAGDSVLGDRAVLEELKQLNDEALRLARAHRQERVEDELVVRRQGKAVARYLQSGADS